MTKAVNEEFGALLLALVRRYGSRAELGKQIGMSGSRVGRAINGQDTFNIENCLRLALATGESASTVLRAAGKSDIADLIEQLYGKGRPTISAAERELLDTWERLTPDSRDALQSILQKLPSQRRSSDKSTSRRQER